MNRQQRRTVIFTRTVCHRETGDLYWFENALDHRARPAARVGLLARKSRWRVGTIITLAASC
jgi:hypothetical protein